MPTEAYALCPLIKRAPHVTEKGYICVSCVSPKKVKN